MPSDNVTTTQIDDVLVITMDDGKANALSFEMIGALSSAIDQAENDDGIRSIVIAGRDGKFSAGFDLSVMMSGETDQIVSLVADGGDLVRKIYGCGLPVVAACNGHALAAGALILLACDVRVGSAAPAKIGLNEVAIGMTLPDWALTLAGQRLSRRHAQRSIANARITDGPGAVDVGFLDMVVEPDQVLPAAIAEAQALSPLDPSAYCRTVRSFRGATLDAMGAEVAADRSRTG